MKRKLSPPPPTNKILRVYYIGIPIHSFFFNEEEAIPPPPTNKILGVYYIEIPIQQVESSGLQ